jgi:hypothetical protein
MKCCAHSGGTAERFSDRLSRCTAILGGEMNEEIRKPLEALGKRIDDLRGFL